MEAWQQGADMAARAGSQELTSSATEHKAEQPSWMDVTQGF